MNFILLIFALLFLNVNVSAQTGSEVIWICHTQGAGDRFSHTLIGTKSNNLIKAEKKLQLEEPFVQKYVVDEKLLKVIREFISKNCDTKNYFTETSVNIFTMRIISNSGIKICYLGDKVKSKSYLRRLIKSISKSPKKRGCASVILECKGFLRSLE